MHTKLYNYQKETADDIYIRIINHEIRGAYIAYETRCTEKLSLHLM